jgi:N-acetylneuraminate synthase
VLGAVTLGARVIEKHFTDDVSREGPDHKFSMDFNTWKDMVNRTRELENSLGLEIKKVEDNEAETVVLQRRSIRVKKDLAIGNTIREDDLEFLRPCPEDALPPYELEEILDKELAENIKSGDYIKWTSIK